MEAPAKCLKCGGTDLKPGELCISYILFPVSVFRFEGQRSFGFGNAALPIKTTICLDCGFVDMSGDPVAARAFLQKTEAR
jgi:hypothetical protein